jgi:hypothetical protein
MGMTQAQGDASYVLDWLKQTHANETIIKLQERVVEAVGGYVGPLQRVDPQSAQALRDAGFQDGG